MLQRILVPSLLLLFAAALIVSHLDSAGGSTNGPESARRSESTALGRERRAIAERVFDSADVLVVTGASEPTRAEMHRAFESMFAQLSGGSMRDQVVSSDEVTPADFVGRPVVLIGTPTSNPHVAAALEGLPVYVGERTLRLLDEDGRMGHPLSRFARATADTTIALRAVNPWSPHHGLVVYTGIEDRALIDFRFSLDLGDDDYLLRIRDIRMRWGRFDNRPGRSLRPSLSESNLLREGERSEYETSCVHRTVKAAGAPMTAKPLYTVSFPNEMRGGSRVPGDFQNRGRRLVNVLNRLVQNRKPPALRAFLYPDRETKGALTGDLSYMHGSLQALQVHSLFDGRFAPMDVSTEIAMARDEIFRGSFRSPAIRDGVPIAAAEHWHGRKLAFWQGDLVDASLVPSLRDLLDPAAYREMSPYVALPAAGAFCAYVWSRGAEQEGGSIEAGLRSLMEIAAAKGSASEAAAKALEQPLRSIERGWKIWMRDTAQRESENDSAPTSAWVAEGRTTSTPQAGVHLTHSYRLDTGLASANLTDSLQEARGSLAVEWITLRPSTAIAAANTPELLDFPPSNRKFVNGMQDGALIECLDRAQELGVHVLLAPTIDVPDDATLAMASRNDWSRFFDQYRAVLVHHATLAEQHGVDMLSIGTDLGPLAEKRTRDWEALIRVVRKIYSGPLVYSAGSPAAMERLSFGGSLDAVGLDLRVPAGPACARIVDEAVKRCEARARTDNKPVLLTSVRIDAGPGSDDEAVSGAVATVRGGFASKPWLGGVHWWRWSTDPELNRRARFGVTPAGPETRREVVDWFRRMRP